jgi:hypothetical protein
MCLEPHLRVFTDLGTQGSIGGWSMLLLCLLVRLVRHPAQSIV